MRFAVKNLKEICHYTLADNTLILQNEVLTYEVQGASALLRVEERAPGRTAPHLLFTVGMVDGHERRFGLWPDIPFVWMPSYQEECLLTLEGEHWGARTIMLYAFSDDYDTRTTENSYYMFARNMPVLHGEIFFLEDMESDRAIVIVSEAPEYQETAVTVRHGAVQVQNGGYAISVGFCRRGECEAMCRAYYRHTCHRPSLLAMSNTWGDCNGYSRVCEEFVLREIDMAERLGVDIVQIDDGWQTGCTGDPAILDENRRRCFRGNFWEPSAEKFPHGMRYVTDYAAARGVRVGMWFAPDSHDHFALLERDKTILRRAYEEWGIRFFKLDMFWIHDRIDCDKMRELLAEVYAFGDDVDVQLDVTRDPRLKYLCGHEYGTVFVENRYTKSGNAYPHRVLRNLWMLGRYLPTDKFQFELINPALNQESYSAGDPFAPSRYTIDYLFATVMLANPLFWMEMQFLSAEQQETLVPLIQIWQQCRADFVGKDVLPIGDLPNGRAFSGFVVNEGGRATYLLLFREVTVEDTVTFRAPVKTGSRAVVLSSNGDVSLTVEDGAVRATFSSPRCYAFIKLTP